jgi:hypothetical protein
VPIEQEGGWAPQKFWALIWGDEKMVLPMLRMEPEFLGLPALSIDIIPTKSSRFLETKTEGQTQTNDYGV